MSDGELNRMEREVEDARARLAADLERLRAPETFASFKSELAAEVQHTKDDWIAKTRGMVNERATRVLDDLKARAAANPLAAGAIGAGLIWHLVRHPPITTILIGLGVYGLMRTEPNEPDVVTPVLSRAREIAASTTNKVTELVDDAREVVDHTSEVARSLGIRAAHVAGSVASQAAGVAGSLANKGADTAQSAAEIADSATERFGAWTNQKREAAAEALSQFEAQALSERTAPTAINIASDNRDGILLGAAAIALVAAVGVAYGRQAAEHSQGMG
jgi:hypothetical protein